MQSLNSNAYWYKADSGVEASKSVFAYVRELDKNQSYKQIENIKNMRLYGNMGVDYYRTFAGARRQDSSSAIQHRVTMNVIQSMIDTVTSKITKNKPRPQFLTQGGNFTLQRRAKRMTQFMEGQFEATEFYSKAAIAFLDSCIFGTGCLKIFRAGNNIQVERVFIDEIKVDDREALYGFPTQMHQEKYIHRDVLKQMFPDKAKQIEQASNVNNYEYMSSVATGESPDMIRVIESWKLKSGPEAKDGRHMISIFNLDLLDEEYNKSYFPFVFWRWGLRPLGFFGQGLSEQLQGIQLEINKILRTIQVSMHLVSVPKIFVDAASKIVDAHLDNRIGSIIKFTGQPPTPGQLGTIPPELFSHLDRLYQRAYEIAGVSQLSATAQKPAGLDSGKALREYNDLETERFMSVAQRYEKVFIDSVRQFIDLAKEIDADLKESGNSGMEVKVKGRKFLETIKWADVNMEEDQYLMSVFPASALSRTPAGRQAEVRELMNDGFVSKQDAMKLLDLPDLQAFYDFETAPGEDIDMVIEKIIEDGDYMTPEPYQDLEYGINKMQKAYLLFRSQNAPEDRLELIRRWIEDAYALMEKALVKSQRQNMEVAQETQNVASQQLEAQLPPEAMGAAPQVPQS